MGNNTDAKLIKVIPNNQEALMIFSPTQVLDEAKKAAIALKTVVEQKPKKVIINNEVYIEFEDWQTLGWFYGITAGATETQEIWRNQQLIGFKAKAEAYKNGVVISRAESACMKDEPNWRAKPEFQLKSMAQTRACSKVLGNVLRWVVVLAGYRGTPAEEMNNDIQTPSQPTKPAETAQKQADLGICEVHQVPWEQHGNFVSHINTDHTWHNKTSKKVEELKARKK